MDRVNKYIKQGFEPLGKVVVFPEFHQCIQTLVKKNNEIVSNKDDSVE